MQHLLIDRVKKILCLGAHADDIEIGCGGTLLKLIQANANLEISWIVFSADETRKLEAADSAGRFLEGAKKMNFDIKNFPDRFFPTSWREIKNYFGELSESYSGEHKPDLIFTHRLEDRHQDHRVLSELTWNAFRDHWILEYEIPKYEGDLGNPNVFVPLTSEVVERKNKMITECFTSQKNHHWFDEETFRSLMRIRGLESNSCENYAEGFYSRKLVLDVS